MTDDLSEVAGRSRSSARLQPPQLFALTLTIFVTLASSCRNCGPEHFVDATVASDLSYVNYTGDNLYYLIDSIGSGLAAGDIDGDSRPDLVLLTGSAIIDSFKEEAAQYTNALWRNEGGTFQDVTASSGLGTSGWSNGAVLADVDSDEDLDLFVACHGPNLLWRNNGDGTFTNVAGEAGVDDSRWGVAGCFADFDGDGDLDLYVTNYADYDIAKEKDTVTWYTVEQFPQFFEPSPNILYRNNGDGTFTDITNEAGIGGNGLGMTALASDFDDDGDPDLFVANDIGFNELFRNDGHLDFVDVSLESGVSCDFQGVFQASMGAASADYDGDGDLDIMVTNYGAEYHTLYRNDGDGLFTDVTHVAGLVSQKVLDTVGWGIGFFDFDLDGHLDVLAVNGHVVYDHIIDYMHWLGDDEQAELYPHMQSPAYNMGANQPNLLFLNNGDGTFRDESHQHGLTFCEPFMSRGAAFADFDDDGRVDVAISNKNQPARVLLNRIPPRGNWLKLELRAASPNPFAVGARIQVEAGERSWTREILAGSSYSASNEYTVHVGLGSAERADRVRIRWPDRSVEIFGPLDGNTTHRLIHGQGESEGPFAAQPSSGPSGAADKK